MEGSQSFRLGWMVLQNTYPTFLEFIMVKIRKDCPNNANQSSSSQTLSPAIGKPRSSHSWSWLYLQNMNPERLRTGIAITILRIYLPVSCHILNKLAQSLSAESSGISRNKICYSVKIHGKHFLPGSGNSEHSVSGNNQIQPHGCFSRGKLLFSRWEPQRSEGVGGIKP